MNNTTQVQRGALLIPTNDSQSPRAWVATGIIGGSLLLLSEFLAWNSDYTAIELGYLFGFTYLLPLISGLVILAGNVLRIVIPRRHIVSIMVQFFGLSLALILLLDYLGSNWNYVARAQVGFVLFLGGMMATFLGVIGILASKKGPTE